MPAHADLFNPPLCARIATLIKPELRKLSKLIDRNKKPASGTGTTGGDGDAAASSAIQGMRYVGSIVFLINKYSFALRFACVLRACVRAKV